MGARMNVCYTLYGDVIIEHVFIMITYRCKIIIVIEGPKSQNVTACDSPHKNRNYNYYNNNIL